MAVLALSSSGSLDVVLAGLGLVLLAPVFAFIALRMKLESPGPVFYRHERVGMNGRPFELIKFRTMFLEHSHRGEIRRRGRDAASCSASSRILPRARSSSGRRSSRTTHG